ncbi:hypothetical protein OU597_25065, partial [Escherichia coli]|nr:hypothetical protein [Escherichia coli]
DRNRSHWSTSKTPSYTKSVSWQHHRNDYEFACLINYHAIDSFGAEAVSKLVISEPLCPFIALSGPSAQ